MEKDIRRLVVVSNRLPVSVVKDEDGGWSVVPGSGGLVTALSPVLRNRGGIWIGWLGHGGSANAKEVLAEGSRESGYRLLPVELTREEVDGYYVGFSNEVLWMLFHDFISLCNFEPAYWPVYQQVNQKFADAIARHTHPRDYIWVHDYHLLLVAAKLRAMGVKRRVGFFMHTPFPPLDGFLKLPWRGDILEGMLQYDLLGFQTMRDMRNFIQCARRLIPKAHITFLSSNFSLKTLLTSARALLPGGERGKERVEPLMVLKTPRRELRVGAFPISIDFKDFMRRAAKPEVNEEVERINHLLPKSKLIFGLDRLDYSKGIPLRIRAFGEALASYPELRGNVCLLQVVIPSRMDVERYQMLKREIDRLVGEINGRYSEAGWTPVSYIFRSLAPHELLAYYRRSDIALVTPYKDGMNLIAKEYCACQLNDDGVLILSEFAGAAAQLSKDAVLVNPYDIKGMAAAIHRAYHMSPAERHERMRNLRRSILQENIYRWVDSFLSAAISKRMKDFPPVADYVPALHRAPAPAV